MTVTVAYYAVLRDITGRSSESVQLPEGSDGARLIEAVVERYPKLVPYAGVLRLATEEAYIRLSDPIAPNGTISMIPPVSGG